MKKFVRCKKKKLSAVVLRNRDIPFYLGSALGITVLTSILSFLHYMVISAFEEVERQKQFIVVFREHIDLLKQDLDLLLLLARTAPAPIAEQWPWESFVYVAVVVVFAFGGYFCAKGVLPFFPKVSVSETLTIKDLLLELTWHVHLVEGKVESVYLNTFAAPDRFLTMAEYVVRISAWVPNSGVPI